MEALPVSSPGLSFTGFWHVIGFPMRRFGQILHRRRASGSLIGLLLWSCMGRFVGDCLLFSGRDLGEG